MIVQTVREIDLDVSKNQYIKLDVKQYDRNTRYILITCYHQGEFIPINKTSHFASIRYWKPDEYGVFNTCEITEDGKILVELTEQMLAVAGVCYVDVVIHENVNLSVNIIETEEGTVRIEDAGDSGILSTMQFIVYVHEAAFDNELVESSYEYNALNDLMTEARRNYTEVSNKCYEYKNAAKDYRDAAFDYMGMSEIYMNSAHAARDDSIKYATTSQRYAVGGTGTGGEGEDTDNAKYYYQESLINANSADESEANALKYRNETVSYTVGGTGTREGEDTDNAKYYYQESLINANSASDSAVSALDSKIIAVDSANTCVSYTVGGTDTRDGEDIDNAKWYYEQSKMIASGLNGALLPMGTITFEQLSTMTKEAGYMYNISNEFVSTSEFKDGGNYTYPSGTNVYFTADGFWDCLAGTTSITATVDEVKDYLGI